MSTPRVPQVETLLLRIPEAAASIGCGRSTIYLLINAGELKPIYIGRAVRISAQALREFVERKRREAEAERTDGR